MDMCKCGEAENLLFCPIIQQRPGINGFQFRNEGIFVKYRKSMI